MKNALVVWGGLELHEPQSGADTVAAILREEGFDVEITPHYSALGDAQVSGRDLVVPVITGGVLEKAELAGLMAAVKQGTGIAAYHGGMTTNFRDNVEFRYMAGSIWVSHPGDIFTYRVDVTATDDPIMAGIESFEHTSEQYYLQFDPAVDVLATTTFSGEHHPWRKNVVMPVVYKTTYGVGRVFYSSLGHVAAELKKPQIETILRRGLVWAAR